MNECPLPNDEFDGAIVVASGWPDDEHFGLLLLEDPPDPAPYYRIVCARRVDLHIEWEERHENIVPAAAAFHDQFGLWGG